MTTNDSNATKNPGSGDEQWTPAGADRAPTAEEAKAADEAAKGVDLDKVAKHEEEMMETGANIKGEGQIEPGTS